MRGMGGFVLAGVLLRRDVFLGGHLVPAVVLLHQAGFHLLGGLVGRQGADFLHAFAGVFFGEDDLEFLVQSRHHVSGRAVGHHDAAPRAGFEARKALLGDRLHLGQEGACFRGTQRHGLEFAGLDVGHGGNQVGVHDWQLSAQQIGDGRCAALVGDVLEFDASEVLELFHRQVPDAAGARAGVIEFLGFGDGQQLLQVLHPGQRLGVDDDDIGQVVDRGDAGEVFARVVEVVAVNDRRDQGGHAEHGNRVAVGRGLDECSGADGAGSAGLVFDDDGLAQAFGQFLCDQARCGVGRAACRKGDHHADDLVGPCGGGSCRQGGEGGAQCACGTGQKQLATFHGSAFIGGVLLMLKA